MKRTLITLAALLVLAPQTANAYTRTRSLPAVQITSLTETCGASGYTWLDVTMKANVAGTYDLWVSGDSDGPWSTFIAETDTLAAGEVLSTTVDLPYPQQEDVYVTRTGQTTALTSKTVAAVSTCG